MFINTLKKYFPIIILGLALILTCLVVGFCLHSVLAIDSTDNISIVNSTVSGSKSVSEIIEPGDNILLLCTDSSRILYDTICIININKENDNINMVMIPRDTYIPYSDEILTSLKGLDLYNVKGMHKINSAGIVAEYTKIDPGHFNNSNMSFMKELVKEYFDVDIDHYICVNFQGFTELIDTFGGMEITVSQDIRSSAGEMIFPKGPRHMSGAEALRYARTRTFYDESGNILDTGSDYVRKENQLAMIKEMIPQVFKISNISKIPHIISLLKNNIYHSFSTSELVKYCTIAYKAASGKVNINTTVITGKWCDPFGDNASYVELR